MALLQENVRLLFMQLLGSNDWKITRHGTVPTGVTPAKPTAATILTLLGMYIYIYTRPWRLEQNCPSQIKTSRKGIQSRDDRGCDLEITTNSGEMHYALETRLRKFERVVFILFLGFTVPHSLHGAGVTVSVLRHSQPIYSSIISALSCQSTRL